MKKAWIEDSVVRDVCPGNPEEAYHPDIAQHYDTQVPDDAANGDGWDGTTLTKPKVVLSIAPAMEVNRITQISPVEFKLRFTATERIAMRTNRATDPGVDDLFDLLEDPRLASVDLTHVSTKDAVSYLAAKGYIAEGRVMAILQTEFPVSGTAPVVIPVTAA